jgi:hypothetical protein
VYLWFQSIAQPPALRHRLTLQRDTVTEVEGERFPSSARPSPSARQCAASGRPSWAVERVRAPASVLALDGHTASGHSFAIISSKSIRPALRRPARTRRRTAIITLTLNAAVADGVVAAI